MARRKAILCIRLIGQRLHDPISPRGRGRQPPQGAVLLDRWRGGVLRWRGAWLCHLLAG